MRRSGSLGETNTALLNPSLKAAVLRPYIDREVRCRDRCAVAGTDGWTPMNSTMLFKEPTACTQDECLQFARLVREGFAGARDLDARIPASRLLAFHYAAAGPLVAIAALKAPGEQYREDVFRKAGAAASHVDYELELGWVFVAPSHRRQQVAATLCRRLMARVAASSVFATTRTDNVVMTKILVPLGFTRVGRPYPRRGEQLLLFLRPNSSSAAPLLDA